MKLLKYFIISTLLIAVVLGGALTYLAAYPAQVLNAVANRWLPFELSVDNIDYHIERDRLVLFVQGLALSTETPRASLELAQFGLDLGFGFFGERYLAIQEVGLAGLRAKVVQQGDVPWWQQFVSQEGGETEEVAEIESDEEATPWSFRLGAINLHDIDVDIDLTEVKRNYRVQLQHFSSGLTRQNMRWVQSNGEFNGKPIYINGETLALSSILKDQGAFDLDLDVNFANVTVQAEGKFDPFENAGNTHLSLEVDAGSIEELLGLFGLQVPEVEDLRLSAVVSDKHGDYLLDEVLFNIETEVSRVTLSGSIVQPLQQWQPDLDVVLKTSSLGTILKNVASVDMATDLAIDASGKLRRKDGFLLLENTHAGVTLAGFAYADGHQFEVAGASVRLPKDEIHGWDDGFVLPLEVRGGLGLVRLGKSNVPLYYDIDLTSVDMEITTVGMDLTGKATYKGLEAGVQFRMWQDWDLLSAQVNTTGLSASLASDLTRDYFPLDFRLSTKNLLAANQLLQWQLPESARVSSSGSVRIANNGTVSVHKLKATVKDGASYQANIPFYQVEKPDQLAMAVKLDVPSTVSERELLDTVIAYTNEERWALVMESLSTRYQQPAGEKTNALIPMTATELLGKYTWLDGALGLAMDFKLNGEKLSFKNLDVDFKGEQLALHAEGKVINEPGQPVVDLELKATAQPNSLLEGFPQALSLQGQITSQGYTVYGSDITLASGDSTARLNFTAQDPFGEKPELVASIESDYVDLTKYFNWDELDAAAEAVEESAENPLKHNQPEQPDQAPENGQRLFSDAPYPMEFLNRLDAMVSVRLGMLDFERFDIRDLRFDLSLRDRHLRLSRFRMHMLEGLVYGSADISPDKGSYQWSMNGVVQDLDFSNLVNRDPELKNAGLLNLRTNLYSRGQSAHTLMAGLNGRFTVSANDLVVHGINVDMLAPNFIKGTLQLINPLRWGQERVRKTHFECALVHSVFGNGLMEVDRTILARTPESTFVGSWFVDFETEEQRVQLIPRIRKGIAISTSDLAKTVQVTGTLTQPTVEVDPAGLFLVGAGSVALYATGGILYYLAWQQIERNLTRPDACEKAVEQYMPLPLDQLQLPVRQDKLDSKPLQS